MRLEKLKRILVPFDFSEPCEAALKTAMGLAKATEAEIELLHVYDAPNKGLGKDLMVSSEKALKELGEYVDKKLSARADRIRKNGFKCKHIVKQGSAHVEILKYARKQKVDLIVIGTHGRGGFEYAVIGSVAERVVQGTCCPTLVVPRKQKKH